LKYSTVNGARTVQIGLPVPGGVSQSAQSHIMGQLDPLENVMSGKRLGGEI